MISGFRSEKVSIDSSEFQIWLQLVARCGFVAIQRVLVKQEGYGKLDGKASVASSP